MDPPARRVLSTVQKGGEIGTLREASDRVPLLAARSRVSRAMTPVGEQLDRRLVAVMFTDVVGYTALMEANERVALDKRDRYVNALDSHHAAFGGTIVQRLGDGSMSMFPSSLAAGARRSRDPA